MNNSHQTFNSPDDLLDEVIDQIRMEHVPEIPDMAPVTTSSVRVNSGSYSSRADTLGKTPGGVFAMIKWPALATAIALLVFVGFSVWPQTNQSALAQVQEAMNSVKSVSYTVMDYHANGNTFQTDVLIVSPHFSRANAIYADCSQITNLEENFHFTIDHRKKTATFKELDPTLESLMRRSDFLAQFREIPETATRLLGSTTFQGKAAEEFVVPFGDRDFNVIVDAETMLPVQMTYDGTADGNPGFREVFENFVFDGVVDMSVFDPEAPKDYAVKRIELNPAPADGEHLTVSPTTGLAPLGFGCDEQQVIDFLGKPENTRKTNIVGIRATPDSVPAAENDDGNHKVLVELQYNSLGLILSFNSKNGLASIQCLSQLRNGTSVRDFVGQTTEGIQIGDPIEKVTKTYGQPDLNHNHVLRYVRKGWSFYEFDGKVQGIDLKPPTPDELEIEVNQEDGSWSIRLKDDD